VADGIDSVENNATIDADLNGDDLITEDDGELEVDLVQEEWTRTTLPDVPDTGFEPGVMTKLHEQPLDKQYQYFGDVWLEIPALKLKTTVVGVPLVDDDWDVSWLTSQTGWLEGSAFPTHVGNSILTSHVYLPNGLPGPFVNLQQLTWDDQIIVHAYGQKFIYKVRVNNIIQPDDPAATKHEEYPWLTLLTCKGFNDITNRYDYRIMVRAVLIGVQQEYFH
jgi:LPXTG-site transpeptidase (sortase) family protein